MHINLSFIKILIIQVVKNFSLYVYYKHDIKEPFSSCNLFIIKKKAPLLMKMELIEIILIISN